MKKKVSWTIDEEIIELVDERAKEDDRSSSYTVNEILEKHFGIKEKKKWRKKF